MGMVLLSLSGRDKVLQQVLPTLYYPKIYPDEDFSSLFYLST
jgi:hypothetical protein